MIFLAGFIVAMLLTMVLMPLVKAMGYRFQIVDIPNHRKVHAVPIPRIGGVAMVLGASVPLLIWLDLGRELLGYLLGALVILVFGILDDRFELNYKLKFGAQFVAVALAVVYGGLKLESLHVFSLYWEFPEIISIGFTSLFVLAAINAVNFSDGLDGLAGGVVLLSLSAVMVLALRVDATDIVLICAVLIGSLLGFLLFNSHPAQIFMGDSGSQFLGFSLSVLAVYLVQERDVFSTFLPMALVGLPLADVLLVIISRLLRGKSPFEPDKNHIHHRLMSLGLKQYGSVFVIYMIQGLIIGTVLLQRYSGDTFYIVFFAIILLGITGIMLSVEKSDKLGHADDLNRIFHTPVMLLKKLQTFISDFDLARWARLISVALIAGYLLLGTLAVDPVTTEIGIIAGALFLLFIIFQPTQITDKLSGWFTRFIYYLAVSGVLFLLYTTPGIVEHFKPQLDILFIILALLIVIGIEYSDDQRLNARPIDFLVIVTALILSGVSGDSFGSQLYWITAVHLLVIFYGVELALIFYRNTATLNKIQILYSIPLAILAVRGVFGL